MDDNTKISINKMKINNNAIPGSIESTLFNIGNILKLISVKSLYGVSGLATLPKNNLF